jgi:hypothetical protein
MATSKLLRPMRGALVRRRVASWPPFTRLFSVGQTPSWVTGEEARAISTVARRLDVDVGPTEWAGHVNGQCVFHFDRFSLLRTPWVRPTNRIAVAYYHGVPGTPGYPEFDVAFHTLAEHHLDLCRIRVSNRAMRDLLLETGIEADKVHLIPIGLEDEMFSVPSSADRERARDALGVPPGAVVVGALLQDGVGMGVGLEPKLG